MTIIGYSDLRNLTPDELTLLSEDERLREFVAESRRQQFQCGRALIRLMLQEVTGRAAAEHEIVIEKGGKPICIDGPAISITHNRQSVACCIATQGLAGIDIESIDRERDTTRIAQRFFSPAETTWLQDNPDGFYMLWVLKEAFVKAHGKSIYGGLDKFHCTIEPPVISVNATEDHFRDLSLYRRDDEFLGLTATEEELSNVEFRYWPPEAGHLVPGNDFRLIAATNAGSQSRE